MRGSSANLGGAIDRLDLPVEPLDLILARSRSPGRTNSTIGERTQRRKPGLFIGRRGCNVALILGLKSYPT